MFGAISVHAAALPSGGHYVSGKGEIGRAGQSLTVKQSSTTGIIDWNNFSISKTGGVTFDNGAGATLNRVTGGNLSTIAGALHATGSLYLMNNAGVIVSGTGKVVTGGNFVATSGNIGTAFDSESKLKAGNGKIVNKGTIVSGGSTDLVGSDVVDRGTVHASAVDLRATDKLAISGGIAAQNSDGSGGTVIATARHIKVGGSADIDASGSKGGTVLIGGDIHGGSIASDNFVSQTMKTAKTTSIAKGARISADGSGTTGGNVVIWSDGHTTFAGQISARGKTAGGFTEVSSHDLLGFTGAVDLTSTIGKTGTLLLDPYDVVISTDADTSGFIADSFTSIINTGTLEAALATANVQVTTGASGGPQLGNISIIDPLSWSSSSTLQLIAANSIVIAAPVKITGTGGLVLQYGGTFDTVNGVGSVTFGNLNDLLGIEGTSYQLENSLSQLATDIAASPNGHFALASNITAPTTAYTSAPIPTTFTGTLEGLGNSISGLEVSDATDQEVGLFGMIGTGGTVRDLDLIDPAILSSLGSTVAAAGALAGENLGTVNNVRAMGGSVSGGTGAEFEIGGLIGLNDGSITSSTASDNVSGTSVSDVGGLVGYNNTGIISSSSASGAVAVTTDSDAGCLIGFNGAIVTSSYATGSVTGAGGGALGGLVGGNSSDGNIKGSYATGDVKDGQGSDVGGLVGNNIGGTITNTYAMGSVTGGGAQSDVGGLVGHNANGGDIASSYSTGKVGSAGTGDDTGGFVGDNQGIASGSYFDADTSTSTSVGSGTTVAVGADSATGITALSTAQMMNVSNMPGLTFGTTPDADGFVVVDLNGTYNNQSNSAGGTLPMLLSEATSPSNIHIIDNAHQIELIGLDSDGTYFLSGNVNMSATSSGKNVWTVASGFIPTAEGGFAGNFFGGDKTLSNLFIDDATGSALVGLFGWQTSGRIQDVSLTNANVTAGVAGSYTGILTGQGDGGVIENVAVSGTVHGASAGAAATGGVMGGGAGAYTGLSSSATVEDSSSGYTGGLIGRYDGDGSLTLSHASGAVSGTGSVGGLIGADDASIASSYATGSITGGDGSNVGGLVGYSTAEIASSYATGAVTAGNDSIAGGLAGQNSNEIFSSYATGAVKAGNESFVGGFVGQVQGDLSGVFATGSVVAGTQSSIGGLFGNNNGKDISEAYALGIVTGGLGSNIGAFGGENSGTVEQSYATGFVSSGGGGFLGANFNTAANAITDSYWDTQTTGASAGIESGTAQAGLVGKTTSQLQSALPPGFDPADWSIVAGKSFAYLDWQVPSGTPQVVSGAISGSDKAGISVGLLISGAAATPLAAMSSGANGYYYELLAPGTISNGEVLAYLQGKGGAAFADKVTGSITGLNIDNDYLNETTGGSSYASVVSDLATAIGGKKAVQKIVSGLSDLAIDATGVSFAIDHNINLGTGTLKIDDAGTLSESGGTAIHAGTLTGTSHGSVALTSANNVITDLGTYTAGGNFALTDDHGLKTTGAINAGKNELTLTTTGNVITIGSVLSAGTVDLVSPKGITETGSGAIDATTLIGSSHKAVVLTGAKNVITDLGAFAAGNFTLTDDHALKTTGKVTTGKGNLILTTTAGALTVGSVLDAGIVDLVSANGISESGSGAIDATTLKGSSHAAVALNGANNVITHLGAFTAGGNFALADDHGLTVSGAVNAGTGTVTLTTLGTGHNLTIASTLTGATVNLTTTGEATETKKGAIVAGKILNVTAKTGISLTSAKNKIQKLGTDKTNSGPNKVTL